jgi:cold-inducible RNA-binding protein
MNIDPITIAVAAGIIIVLILLIVFIAKRRRRDTDTDSSEQIYVGNLAYRVSERDLRGFFKRYGEISDVRVIRNPHTRKSKGFAFVTFASGSSANDALEAHGMDFRGRTLVVRIAKPR